jgi:hypothetical protein
MRPAGTGTMRALFVRLHQPSSCYGVNSLPLGSEAIDSFSSNRGRLPVAA